MGKYTKLTKYISLFERQEFGKWVIDTENDGTFEQPIQMPRVDYYKEVDAFIEDAHSVYDNLNCDSYIELLNEYGIAWDSKAMRDADISKLPAEAICALIIGAVRADKFCEGALLSFCKSGCILKWLLRLKEIDDGIGSMAEIKLNDLLKLTDEEIARVRIRLNRDNGVTDPIDEFKKNPQTLLTWNYWNNHSFKENQISIGLVNMGNDRWLLFTVGVIKKVVDKPKDFKGVQVEYYTLKKYEPLYGRVVVKYHNTVQQMIRKGELLDELVVSEILPSVFTGFDFPGYDKVCLSYSELENIVNGNHPSYQNALKNQKAVYVQTDKHTGKLYVGSATAEKGMLLARWKNYVDNGHGGNVGLKELIDKEGFEYIKNNFQYTIIENFNSKVDDKYVLERESYWKTVLQTREFGYNKN